MTLTPFRKLLILVYATVSACLMILFPPWRSPRGLLTWSPIWTEFTGIDRGSSLDLIMIAVELLTLTIIVGALFLVLERVKVRFGRPRWLNKSLLKRLGLGALLLILIFLGALPAKNYIESAKRQRKLKLLEQTMHSESFERFCRSVGALPSRFSNQAVARVDVFKGVQTVNLDSLNMLLGELIRYADSAQKYSDILGTFRLVPEVKTFRGYTESGAVDALQYYEVYSRIVAIDLNERAAIYTVGQHHDSLVPQDTVRFREYANRYGACLDSLRVAVNLTLMCNSKMTFEEAVSVAMNMPKHRDHISRICSYVDSQMEFGK